MLFKSQKHVFWEALLIAVFIFGIGIFIGLLIENNRTKKIDILYANSEIELLDIRTWGQTLEMENIDCATAVQENINFANRIYEEAKILGRYEKASRISDILILRHKKYDLLRTMFWINAIKLKKRKMNKCNVTDIN